MCCKSFIATGKMIMAVFLAVFIYQFSVLFARLNIEDIVQITTPVSDEIITANVKEQVKFQCESKCGEIKWSINGLQAINHSNFLRNCGIPICHTATALACRDDLLIYGPLVSILTHTFTEPGIYSIQCNTNLYGGDKLAGTAYSRQIIANISGVQPHILTPSSSTITPSISPSSLTTPTSSIRPAITPIDTSACQHQTITITEIVTATPTKAVDIISEVISTLSDGASLSIWPTDTIHSSSASGN
jgi:hypothetical protein